MNAREGKQSRVGSEGPGGMTRRNLLLAGAAAPITAFLPSAAGAIVPAADAELLTLAAEAAALAIATDADPVEGEWEGFEALCARRWETENRVLAMTALTPEGAAAKLRTWGAACDGHLVEKADMAHIATIAADLLRAIGKTDEDYPTPA